MNLFSNRKFRDEENVYTTLVEKEKQLKEERERSKDIEEDRENEKNSAGEDQSTDIIGNSADGKGSLDLKEAQSSQDEKVDDSKESLENPVIEVTPNN